MKAIIDNFFKRALMHLSRFDLGLYYHCGLDKPKKKERNNLNIQKVTCEIKTARVI